MGIIFIESCRMIWDRNMLLMFKDTATARFHTLFAIEQRSFHKYAKNHLSSIIIKMYELGDKVLAYNPVNASRNHRTKFFTPELSQELSQENRPSSDFIKYLISLDNKDLLLSVYGSFVCLKHKVTTLDFEQFYTNKLHLCHEKIS